MNSISWIFSLIIPMILHMLLSDAAVILVGQSGDATLCTTLAAVLTIPVAVCMFYWDKKRGITTGNDGQNVSGYRINRNDRAESEKCQGELNRNNRQIFFGILCFMAGGILNMAWSGILNLIQIGEIFSNSTQEALLASEMALQIVGLGILVPIGEELIFRGLIYNRMKQMLSVKMSIFFSSLLFALYHGNPIQMIFSFPMALALTAVYEHGKLFLFPVLFHMGANLTAVFANFFS